MQARDIGTCGWTTAECSVCLVHSKVRRALLWALPRKKSSPHHHRRSPSDEPEEEPEVDEEAGNLGLPFTEPEDEEEWVGWVDWSASGVAA